MKTHVHLHVLFISKGYKSKTVHAVRDGTDGGQ